MVKYDGMVEEPAEKTEVKSKKQLKYGTILSYLVLIVEVAVNLVFIPWLSRSIGQSNYGLYTMATSTIGVFLVDFGLSGSVTKFLADYKNKGDKDGEEKFLGTVYKMYFVIDLVVFAIAFGLYFFLGVLKGLTSTELETFKVIYIIVGAYSIVSLPLVTLNGIFTANEDFVVLKLCSLVQKILTVLFMVLAVVFGSDLYVVVLANVSVSLLVSLFKYFYIKLRYHLKANFKVHDKQLFKTILSFSIWVAIISLAQQLTINTMPTVLGIVADSTAIAVFGFALTIETYAYSISSVVSDMLLPKISRMVASGSDESKFSRLYVVVGKFQLFIIGLIVVGFALVGKEFTTMLMGAEYEESYYCALCLLAPLLISVPKVTMESKSYVLNTIKYSAIIIMGSSVVGFGLSFLLGRYLGALGVCATIGVCETIAYLLRDFLVYQKRQKDNIWVFFKNCYLKYLLPTAIAVTIGLALKYFFAITSWSRFIVITAFIALVYVIFEAFFFLTYEERVSLENFVFGNVFSENYVSSAKNSHVAKWRYFWRSLVLRVHDFFAKRTSKGAPWFLVYSSFVLFLFSSDYAMDKVRLWTAAGAFLINFLSFIYYCFPFGQWKQGKKGFLKSFSNPSIIFATVLSLCFVVTFLANKEYDHPFGIIRLSMIVFAAVFFCQEVSFQDFSIMFRRSMVVLSVVSATLFCVQTIIGTRLQTSIFTENSSMYFSFLYLYFTNAAGALKNYGLFWEPGIFSSFLLAAFILESFDKKPQLYRYIAFAVGILSTSSMAGVLLLVVAFFAVLCRKINRSWTLVFPLGVAIVLCFFFLLPNAFLSFFGKILPSLLDKGVSLTTRFYSFDVDLQVYLTSPIYGVGSEYANVFKDVVSEYYANSLDSSVSTMGYFLASYGLIGFALMAAFCLVLVFLPTKNLSFNLLVFFIGLMIINKEPHHSSTLSWTIFFFAMNEGVVPSLLGISGYYESKLTLSQFFESRRAKNPLVAVKYYEIKR
jgi:O-antigen/teichoic acid export membrane protein